MLRVVFKMGNDRYGRDCIKMRVCHQSPAWCLNYIRDNQLFFKTPRCLGCHKDHAQRCGGFVGSSNFPDVGGSFCDHGGLMAYVWLRGADNSRDNDWAVCPADWAVCPADHAAAISIHRQCVTMLVNAARYIGEEVEFVHD